MEEKIYDVFENMNKKLTVREASMLSPLQLAYIGDAVYELFIRTYLLERDLPVHELHKEAIKYVKAKAQSDIVHGLEDELTEEEKAIVKRGRNAKTYSSPKNADLIDYKYATGFESLIGFLYLTGRQERMMELFHKIILEYHQ
ncbi:Mini-ribonuclease 3 [Sporanaerobacter acetigenes]|uniref:Mini-ribonuclease 3 n=1 Tax=Sporanaerobacter acetigenes DSM 13106 TaxID=1123281 RepID=A0A1M5YR28_9FIRM|nr:ribonuclease III domain-containing protein [Sporanaerobacter acetigenes]SHI14526.1 ribonuclease-3 family protein [Sporanaerobacter acetigenes DSM 13106]